MARKRSKKELTFGEQLQKVIDKHNRRMKKERELFEKIAKGRKQINIMELIE